VLSNYRAAADDEWRREGEAREEASRAFLRATHPVTRRLRCCIAPPDGKRVWGMGDLCDNGGSDNYSPSSSSSSSYEDDDADIHLHGPGGGARCDPDRLIKNT